MRYGDYKMIYSTELHNLTISENVYVKHLWIIEDAFFMSFEKKFKTIFLKLNLHCSKALIGAPPNTQ